MAVSSAAIANPMRAQPTAAAAPTAQAFRTLTYFGTSIVDGVNPTGGLAFANGLLYGATTYGGTGLGGPFQECVTNYNGYLPFCGTVFSVNPASGGRHNLYNFQGATADGLYPAANVIAVNGELYGTTEFGGAYGNTYNGNEDPGGDNGYGTIFKICADGSERILHSFGAPGDGIYPVAGLLDANGTLYGTTFSGGAYGTGTAFSIGPSGAYKTLYSFGATAGDGSSPMASLIAINGQLFGTTAFGGNGYGTVFELSPTGKETVLYRFSGPDGAHPESALLDVNGALYGTTVAGGKYNNGLAGPVDYTTVGGVVFKITKPGSETVMHSFGKFPDGNQPAGALIEVNGSLYGLTSYGGSDYATAYCAQLHGCGTIYQISATGVSTVLHTFAAALKLEGWEPVGALLNVNGTLYGETLRAINNDPGTVFALTL